MCNILLMPCKVCGRNIDMHLADYDTDPEEIEIYCGKHLPEDRRDGILWGYRKKRVFVRALTKNAYTHAGGNHPNDGLSGPVEMFGDAREE
jgi:hypothetical protein